VALRVRADGKPVEAWRVERQVAYLPTPVVKGERVYLMSEQGWATCLDLQTGKEIWQERVGGEFSASPVAAGDHLYCIANNGLVHILKLGDKFERTAKYDLGEGTQCTPAIAGGRMFIRTDKHLLSIGGTK
jgi:outer membrane protein assembly factor BamB